MNLSPGQAAPLAQRANAIPLVGELSGDLLTPVSAFLRLAANRPYAFLLESVEGGERLGRYSFLGFEPWTVMRSQHLPAAGARLEGKEGPPPLEELREVMRGFHQPPLPDLPPFTGGAVGNLAYDAVRSLERLPSRARDDLDAPDLEVAFYDTVVAFDHVRQRIQIVANLLLGQEGRSFEAEYMKAAERIEEIARRLTGPMPPVDGVPFFDAPGEEDGKRSSIRTIASGGRRGQGRPMEGDPVASSRQRGGPEEEDVAPSDGGERLKAWRSGREEEAVAPRSFESSLSPVEFLDRVRAAKEKIASGEIFQVVLSRRVARPFAGDPFSVYRALRAINPSPYNFYLRQGERALAGASPEMLVRVRDGRVETRPIAGTRPRGQDEEHDARLAAELKADPKENAEHLMLVDLGRNDVGRVSVPGCVRVPRFAEIERYSHVMHLVSSVEGSLREGCDSFDALLACFPAGTVSGAPKVRAMEIIEELEPTRRGPYAGAVFYRGFDGALDSAIAIRIVLLMKGTAYVQSGAGIVAESDPEAELRETEEKSRAALTALVRAEEIS